MNSKEKELKDLREENQRLHRENSVLKQYLESRPSVDRHLDEEGKLTDISRRKAMEAAHIEIESKYRSIVESSPNAIAFVDMEGNFITINEQTARLHGYDSTEEFLQQNPNAYELVDSEDYEQAMQNASLLIETGSIMSFNCRLRRRNGSFFYAEISSSAVFDSSRNPIATTSVIRDVSDRKSSEEKQKTTLERILLQQKAITELASHPAIINGDYQEAIRVITEAACETLDVQRTGVWMISDDRKSLNCADLYDLSTKQHQKCEPLAINNYPIYFEQIEQNRVIDSYDALKDPKTAEFSGDYFQTFGIVSTLDAPIRVSGKVVGVICHEQTGQKRRWKTGEYNFAGAMTDLIALTISICERKRAEDALRENQAKYQDIFEGAGDGIIYTDKKANVLDANSTFAKITGLDIESIVGKNAIFLAKKLLSLKDIPTVLKIIKDNIMGRSTGLFE